MDLNSLVHRWSELFTLWAAFFSLAIFPLAVRSDNLVRKIS